MSRYESLLSAAIIAGGMILGATGVGAAEIEVKMLNKGANGMMTFEPTMVKAAVGDVVHFVAADKGHNAESIEGMLPEGIEPFAGKLNEGLTITIEKPGIYGFRCKPHYGMGMVGMIVVGDASNEDAAKAVQHPGMAKKLFAKLFEELDTKKSASAQ
jgi:pseudoazurin